MPLNLNPFWHLSNWFKLTRLEEIVFLSSDSYFQAWDDVERKVKPVTEPFEYKKKIPLDQEKSKLSLSQIYEQEYLKQTQVR